MTTIPRFGFARVAATRDGRDLVDEPVAPRRRHRGRCPRERKIRHPSEADALRALVRVREVRAATSDDRPAENRVYYCKHCQGWHLTSTGFHPGEFDPVRERTNGETWEQYARRLERRIAEQRSQIMSMHALGAGASNRETRKRTAALVVALGRMTERWENERRNREELVRLLDELRSRRTLFARLRLRRTPGAVIPEAASTTERAETSDA